MQGLSSNSLGFWGTAGAQGLRNDSAHFWVPEKAGVRQPIPILFPRLALETPENAGVE